MEAEKQACISKPHHQTLVILDPHDRCPSDISTVMFWQDSIANACDYLIQHMHISTNLRIQLPCVLKTVRSIAAEIHSCDSNIRLAIEIIFVGVLSVETIFSAKV